MKFDTWIFLENLSRKFKFHLNRTRITGTIHEDQYILLIIYHSLLLTMRNVSDKGCRKNENTHFMFYNFFFFFVFENRALYEIMWKNTIESGRPQMKIQHMPKSTNTNSVHVIFIDFPLQQQLHEHAPMLQYMYTSCLVNNLHHSKMFWAILYTEHSTDH